MLKIINALFELFKITQYYTSSYHQNTNDLVKRQNSSIAKSMLAYGSNKQDKWSKLLILIMMSFWKFPHLGLTKFSPFDLMIA